jgi:hypothetical protein
VSVKVPVAVRFAALRAVIVCAPLVAVGAIQL